MMVSVRTYDSKCLQVYNISKQTNDRLCRWAWRVTKFARLNCVSYFLQTSWYHTWTTEWARNVSKSHFRACTSRSDVIHRKMPTTRPQLRSDQSMHHNYKQEFMCVINDPLGQAHSLICLARFWKVGTDGRTDITCDNSNDHPTSDCGSALWINYQYFWLIKMFNF